MTPRAVLIGLPGTGKSTTGRRLAKILSVHFTDSDDLVEHATQRTVPAIFAEDGESTFRELEADAIAAALSTFDGVLAFGGGAIMTARTRDAILAAGVPVVLLRASIQTLRTRIGDGHTRPLLAADPVGRLAALAGQRDPVYRAAATFSVDTDNRTPGQVAATVAARLHERSRT
ncbi:MAG: shikimate kinase [Jatrophihabitantaceae bacterium]